ncbi:hypothetical protein GCM10007103_31990 [Salinimicrobium marinum]|uniref:CarboxypepD_reg-like domain-containing protein n=2 Tax=Salinimicrobium marinum TaxID=680283 RepID=A0A918VZZ1_9FLAO|nr:hypothetical protein GCM10007103_31990 [Salinimicrobium marinum]
MKRMEFNVRLFLMIAAVLFALPSFSQDNILRGVVKADSLRGSSINIVNVTQEIGTTNSSTGEFKIEVMKNDTLLFTAIHLKSVEVIITPEIIEGKFLEVQMDERINELEEVQISNISLTGNLQHDILEIKTYNKEDFGFSYSPKKPLTSIERKLFTARDGEIDALLNFLSGRTKMLKKAKENDDTMEMVEMATKTLPTSFFVENLQIPENRIRAFVYFCSGDPDFQELMAESKRLELLEYFQKKAAEFLN